ncbi:MAG: type I glutamate--ammonia ligase [Desulfurococcales archaeon]|nr:type I glutamate--ammonia ligase [Desulfurococcales archaeon]
MTDSVQVEEAEVHYVDIVGRLHALTIPYRKLSAREIYIDASSVDMLDISNSDLLLKPDESTVAVLPWEPRKCRVLTSMWLGKERFWGDTRYAAERTENLVRSLGYEAMMGAEVEFFIHRVKYFVNGGKQYVSVHQEEMFPSGIYPPKGMYQALDMWGPAYSVREKATQYLKFMGVEATKQHHEVAPNQAEIVTPSGGPLSVGDYVTTIKYVVKKAASELGYIANFMPKPLSDDNGSGMHVHVSLWINSSNVFWDEEGELSQVGRYFVGGILEHGKSIAALVASTTNSYKRLVPGYEAPVYLAWGYANRSVAVRVPKTQKPSGSRVEFRVPDPLSNPYLALSAILLAGLDGVRKKIDPGDPLRRNAYKLSPNEIKELGIETLPRNLWEAIEHLETDNDYLRPAFPAELIEKYIELKKKEVLSVESIPTPAEYAHYLSW